MPPDGCPLTDAPLRARLDGLPARAFKSPPTARLPLLTRALGESHEKPDQDVRGRPVAVDAGGLRRQFPTGQDEDLQCAGEGPDPERRCPQVFHENLPVQSTRDGFEVEFTAVENEAM